MILMDDEFGTSINRVCQDEVSRALPRLQRTGLCQSHWACGQEMSLRGCQAFGGCLSERALDHKKRPHGSCKLDLGSQITRHFQSFVYTYYIYMYVSILRRQWVWLFVLPCTLAVTQRLHKKSFSFMSKEFHPFWKPGIATVDTQVPHMPVNVQTLGADWLVASSALVGSSVINGGSKLEAAGMGRRCLWTGTRPWNQDEPSWVYIPTISRYIPIKSSLIQSHRWAIWATSISLPLHGADLRDVPHPSMGIP